MSEIRLITDLERELQAQVDRLSAQIDEQGGQVVALRDRAVAAEAAIQTAYGYLWCVNNEPGTPIALYPPEKAAYEARKVLRELLTVEQRGQGINSVLQLVRGLSASPAQPAKAPCGECHLKAGEVCDICGAAQPADPAAPLMVRDGCALDGTPS